MDKKTPIINILTYGLPSKLANQIYHEFESRLSEAKYVINLSDRYKPLSKYMDTVEILLAMTIFHKRVISNLEAAVKFHRTVNKYSDADTIRIGTYNFTSDEKNKLLGLTISYNKLREKYGIPLGLSDYELTKDFLIKMLSLLNQMNHDQYNGEQEGNKDDEVPF